MSTDALSIDRGVVPTLGLGLLEQALEGAQQFLRRPRLILDVKRHPGELFQVLNIGAAAPAFKQNGHAVARLIMQFLYELHDQGDAGAVYRLESGHVAHLVGDPRVVN